MAKRNKNREASRPSTGGVRKTANFREVSRSVTRDLTQPFEFFKPDLSAFETINETANARISFDAPASRPAARGTSSRPASARANSATPSKRSLERKNEPVATGRPRISHYQPALLRPNKPQPAKKLERHEVRSARLEPLRVTCKPRPKDTKPKGGGGSGKEFVPWCDRRS